MTFRTTGSYRNFVASKKYSKWNKYLKSIKLFWHILGTKSFSKNSVSFVKKLYYFGLVLRHLSWLFAWKFSKKISKLYDETNRSNQVFASVLSPYLNKNWKLIDRKNAIEQHYRAVNGFACLIDMASNEYLDLIDFNDEDLRVVIDRPDWMRGEGEAVISIFHNEHRIHHLVFSIIQYEDAHVIAIGGIQGWGGTVKIGAQEVKEINVKLTKILHGLHPKIFLLYVVKMLAKQWGLKEIWGISDANHRSNHWLVNSVKYSSYDNFWTDHSGVLNPHGFYAISTELRIKPYEEIPGNKRALFRRRYEMLEQIQSLLAETAHTNQRRIKTHIVY